MNPPVLALETVVVRSPDVVFTELDGEMVLLLPQGGRYFGLNDVGAAIWRLIENPTDLGSVQRAIVDDYEVESEESWRDLVTLIESMIGHGLVMIPPV